MLENTQNIPERERYGSCGEVEFCKKKLYSPIKISSEDDENFF